MVRPISPFSELESYKNKGELTQEFKNKWVIPYSMQLNNTSNEWVEQIDQLKLSNHPIKTDDNNEQRNIFNKIIKG